MLSPGFQKHVNDPYHHDWTVMHTMIIVMITLDNGIYQCLEDQELLLGHTQPLKAVDYQHALQKISFGTFQSILTLLTLFTTLSKNWSRPQREQSAYDDYDHCKTFL